MGEIINISGALIPADKDTPVDIRTRVNTVDEIYNIDVPFLGMLVYCIDDKKYYKVTGLKQKQVGLISVSNAAVDTFEEFGAAAADVFNFAGSVELVDDLPASDVDSGDVYTITGGDSEINYVASVKTRDFYRVILPISTEDLVGLKVREDLGENMFEVEDGYGVHSSGMISFYDKNKRNQYFAKIEERTIYNNSYLVLIKYDNDNRTGNAFYGTEQGDLSMTTSTSPDMSWGFVIGSAVMPMSEKIVTWHNLGGGVSMQDVIDAIQSAKSAIDAAFNGRIQNKQDKLNASQLAAIDSGITSEKIKTLENGLLTGEEKESLSNMASDIDDIMDKVYPLVVEYDNKNNGVFEYGTRVIPSVSWTARKKSEVDVSNITLGNGVGWGDLSQNKKSYVGSEVELESTILFSATVECGGSSVDLPEISWKPSYYRYFGVLDSEPTDFATAIKALSDRHSSAVKTKELSTTATLGSTSLAANKYYLFAVQGSRTLVCRHASTDGVIDGCKQGTVSITQENGYKNNTYSYILVPKSSSAWNFKITNS